jgi:hypothetical protein
MFYLELALVFVVALGIGALLLMCIDYFTNSDLD